MNNWKLKFFILWSGQAVSFFTSAILQMALIWHLAIVTNSALVLSIASIAGFLPMALLGSFAGAYVDRWNRKLTMIGADLYIAVISLSLVIFTIFAPLPLWLVLIVLFLRSIGTAFHMPAISAVTPLIVPETHLTKCSGYTQTVQTLGFIAGTSVAAILYPLWGVRGMVFLDVFGAVFASLTVAIVKIPQPPKIEEIDGEVKTSIFFEIKEGYKIFKENKGLFVLLWFGMGLSIMYSPVNALFPLMSLDHFGGTTTQASIVEVVFALGMLIGGALLGVWGGFKNRGISMSLSMLLIGIGIFASGLLPSNGFIFFAVFSFLIGFASPFYSGPQTALMQERVKPEYLGRVFGLYGSLASFSMLFGLVVTGIFADITGFNVWFIISGFVIIILGAMMILMPSVRKIENQK
ncbi:MAG: MFS transporter [Tannerella sp.]|jgi:DHA3 family macrolide efflux protein-like MFS transporter|nr:MFS transporter [Tannerella sp.]